LYPMAERRTVKKYWETWKGEILTDEPPRKKLPKYWEMCREGS